MLFAKMHVALSYPYIEDLAKNIGGDKMQYICLSKGSWDPHFVVPKPSLIAKVRRADAIIINGAQLEIGWLPPLINSSGNPKVSPSAPTFLNLAQQVELLQKPLVVDRSLGDIHPAGNPHFHLDPNNIPLLAKSIKDFFCKIDAPNSETYEKNYVSFVGEWESHLAVWQQKMEDKKGLKVVQFHDNLAYFNHAYGLVNIGTIEPLPGIPPSSKHTMELINIIEKEKPYAILHDVYHSKKAAEFIASKTDIKIIEMPHDVGAKEDIHSLKELFDYLTGAL